MVRISRFAGVLLFCDCGRKAVGGDARTADNPVNERGKLFLRTIQRPETGHRVRVVEVPCVLRETDEIPDRRVGGPGATKRRTAQVLRDASAQKRRYIASRGNRIDWRQARQIPLCIRRIFGRDERRRIRRFSRLGLRRNVSSYLRLALATRPTSKKFFFAHSCPPSSW